MGEIELITKIMRRVYGRSRTNFGTMKKKKTKINTLVWCVCSFDCKTLVVRINTKCVREFLLIYIMGNEL